MRKVRNAPHPMQPMYAVLRACCTSGNCFHCTRKSPYGTPLRVEQYRTADAAKAAEVARNWHGYRATVVTV